ncbi:flagellar hook assembly protein FlgD [Buchnera aphidicola (Aphis craccivora)]|uniref:Basal-body rod modification protein FlgD n=1 Tax=Buchnera aphidicola (Aphis craccivora) TaxID=466616 RepID=A0A4D6XRY5_9GAMM|nr:flagellar hook assembly protein FlgD [Buchnera aphidicola]QCI16581.1 flagellar hook assembly protein FlgD [Buchnera aphidicola (Aphis craccivora)]QLL40715.1 flagellar hook assembly protein FlgD [Buchnera aphidicola (Aphis craccivore)]WAI17554.1 MAG: flagellar hook assembly protein FlgD [Buchnera aphidicola (Aphis craccivora)]
MSNISLDSSIQNNVLDEKNNTLDKSTDGLNHPSNPLDLQNNFLKLLIAQIKNQDPTDPIKNTELTSQLAQINTATGVEKLNNTVGKFSDKINQNQNIQISSLIGHRVFIPSSQIVHTKDINTEFGIDLISYATSVEIKILDENKKVIHVEKMKDVKPGVYSFIWDGLDLDKNTIPTGKYNVSLTAKNQNKDIPATILCEALVQSIITSSRNPIIDLGVMGNTTLSEIRKIFK